MCDVVWRRIELDLRKVNLNISLNNQIEWRSVVAGAQYKYKDLVKTVNEAEKLNLENKHLYRQFNVIQKIIYELFQFD